MSYGSSATYGLVIYPGGEACAIRVLAFLIKIHALPWLSKKVM